MKKEDKFQETFKKYLERKIRKSRYRDFLKVERNVPIIKDATIGKIEIGENVKEWWLVLGAQKQDIVMYADEFDLDEFILGEEALKKKIGVVKDILIKFEGLEKSQKVIIPLIIFELKCGEGLTTHEILKYSKIASDIKYIFPHSKYFLVISSRKERSLRDRTILRHGKGFDGVFFWKEGKRDLWKRIENILEMFDKYGFL